MFEFLPNADIDQRCEIAEKLSLTLLESVGSSMVLTNDFAETPEGLGDQEYGIRGHFTGLYGLPEEVEDELICVYGNFKTEDGRRGNAPILHLSRWEIYLPDWEVVSLNS